MSDVDVFAFAHLLLFFLRHYSMTFLRKNADKKVKAKIAYKSVACLSDV